MKQILLLCALVCSALVTMESPADAQEARCGVLGSDCKCSQPYNVSTITNDSPTYTYGWTPVGDSSKQCINDGVVVTRNLSNTPAPAMSNNATILAALPSGHSVSYVLKMPDGYTGITEIGYRFATGEVAANERLAYRWYEYYSSDYQATTGTCANSSKWFTIRPGFHESTYQGSSLLNPLMYGWSGWINANANCCNIGPGYDSALSPADVALPGKWWRYEVVMRHMNGTAGAIIQAYRKNITDNAAERTIIDTSVGCTGCGDSGSSWAGLATTALQPYNGDPISNVTTEMFRNGTCAGYVAISHQMMAGWTTDASQRIGAAPEIEGGGGGGGTTPNRFAPGINLRRAAEVPAWLVRE